MEKNGSNKQERRVTFEGGSNQRRSARAKCRTSRYLKWGGGLELPSNKSIICTPLVGVNEIIPFTINSQ